VSGEIGRRLPDGSRAIGGVPVAEAAARADGGSAPGAPGRYALTVTERDGARAPVLERVRLRTLRAAVALARARADGAAASIRRREAAGAGRLGFVAEVADADRGGACVFVSYMTAERVDERRGELVRLVRAEDARWQPAQSPRAPIVARGTRDEEERR